MKKIELLSPAGNPEKLEVAFHYGADAVYLGGQIFTMRAMNSNFNHDELKWAVEYSHNLGKKVYVTVNTIPFSNELPALEEYVKFLNTIKVDGVIVSDLGVFQMVRENTNLNISISTQASNTNWKSVKLWHDMGAKRIVLARELSLDDIKIIKDNVPTVEIETFIHGAMCMSISGRCLLSNYLTARDANRGACAHPCRWKYYLMEEKRPGEFFPVFEDDNGAYIFDSKDICTIEVFDELLNAGVDSLKIEGRMKGINYVASVTKAYREALDSFESGNYNYDSKWLDELQTVSHRHYIPGFLKGKPDSQSHNYFDASYKQTHKMVGKVEAIEAGLYKIAVRNQIKVGDEVEAVTPHPGINKFILGKMLDFETKAEISVANPNSTVLIASSIPLQVLDLLRVKSENETRGGER
ncbi:MAG: U32 family peptidase [Fusobacteria bacterium]|nr:U32 family peptidase [Fusobacteriota bacterium]